MSVGLGRTGTAIQGLAFLHSNPASAYGFKGVLVTRHSTAFGAADIEAGGAYSAGPFTATVDFRRRSWDNLGDDLGVDDLSASESALGLGALAGWRTFTVGIRTQRLVADQFGIGTEQWAFDAGAQVQPLHRLRLGISLLHWGRSDRDGIGTLPTRLLGGVSYQQQLGSFVGLLTVDMSRRTRDGYVTRHFGLDVGTKDSRVEAHARGGIAKLESGWEPAFGGDIGYGSVRLSMAYAIRSLGNEFNVSLGVLGN